jgi:hypothetical protein
LRQSRKVDAIGSNPEAARAPSGLTNWSIPPNTPGPIRNQGGRHAPVFDRAKLRRSRAHRRRIDGRDKLVNDEIGVQWLFSFLSADKRKTFCLYEAVSPEAVRAAAQRLGIPVDSIVEVSEIGPEAALVAALRAQPGETVVHQAS